MNTNPPIRVDSEEHRPADEGFFSDRPPKGPRRIIYYVLLVAPVVLVFPFFEWIGSFRGEWWMEGLIGELLLLPLGAVPMMIGSLMGIFPQYGSRTSAVLGWSLIGCGLPLLWVAGYHVTTVPWAEAPGRWPAWVDVAVRTVLCGSSGLLLITLLARRAQFAPSRLVGLFILLLLAIWPWLGGWVPITAALGLLTVGGALTQWSRRS
jgi:hypothetical protein